MVQVYLHQTGASSRMLTPLKTRLLAQAAVPQPCRSRAHTAVCLLLVYNSAIVDSGFLF